MNKLMFWIMYRFTRPRWDTGITPPEVVEAFSQGGLPAGPALDLGCGTGTNTIYMARQGRQAFGVDFVPRAIAKARAAARQAGVAEQVRFFVADVTKLDTLNLPPCAFALDMGCFHGLGPEGQRRYAELLAAQLLPRSRYMLYILNPRPEIGYKLGIEPQQVVDVFTPKFEITRRVQSAQGQGGATWFWMTLR